MECFIGLVATMSISRALLKQYQLCLVIILAHEIQGCVLGSLN